MSSEPFFIPDLMESVLGAARAPTTAADFLSAPVRAAAKAIARQFADSAPVPHVCLDGALHGPLARAVAEDLGEADFVRHHHRAYPLDIAPLDALSPGALSHLVAWLGTDDAARAHGALVRWRRARLRSVQVQVARARVGDSFPLHVDTDDEGLAAVYNFTRGFRPAHGGVLSFPDARLEVPPRFNSLFLFRSRGAPHAVSPVRHPSASRYTVTAFFLAAG